MAPCNNVRFSYRGEDKAAGRRLASLLSDISIEYNEGQKSVSADLGALIVELDKRVIADQVAEEARRDALVDPYCVGETDPAVHGMVEKQPTIQTAVPPVYIRRRDIIQWLTAMNIPMGVPVTLRFVNDLDYVHDPVDPRYVDPKPFDPNPDATEARRRGEII